MEVTKAEVKNVNLEDSTFNILLTFTRGYHAMLNCRVEGNRVKAYNVGIMDGTCPCCLKPTCASLFSKRSELLIEAQKFTELPKELVAEKVLINS